MGAHFLSHEKETRKDHSIGLIPQCNLKKKKIVKKLDTQLRKGSNAYLNDIHSTCISSWELNLKGAFGGTKNHNQFKS